MKYLIYTSVSERGSDYHGETSCQAQADECRCYALARDPATTFTGVETDEFLPARPPSAPPSSA